ncbi:unnamed protein product [Microthlaspi erraticum]|uniref:Uncharacterized protein n=1 Tax=Microthlaspi erraticum TaxID=1685480 RepID=A0A6D2KS00_9BRAS|nr:unnamed protein product [Microthlaspi erraticum]
MPLNMAYREDLIRRRQELLILEEEEEKIEQKAKKEKKSKKKKEKQKKNKGKVEKKGDTVRTQAEERILEKEDSDPKNQHHSLEQAKPETKDVVPKGKAVTSSSSSSSPDIQLETVVPRVDIQKTASPKPETKDGVPKRNEVPSSSSSPGIQLHPRVYIQKTASPKPEKEDVVPKRKEVPSSSSSSSPDTQLQTVVPRVDIQKTASPKPAAQPVQSISRPVTVRKLLRKQAAPEKKFVWKLVSPRLPPSGQPSSSGEIQLQTVVPRADIHKTASPKLAAQPVQSMSRPVSTPVIPPNQAAPVISAVQTSTWSFAPSMSSAGRLGSPPHSQTYTPQSYKHPILGSSGFNQSSSQPTLTSTLPHYSHQPPISVSSQSSFPINISSWDLSSCGLLWTGGWSSNRDTTTTTATSGNHRTNPSNTPVTTNNIQFGNGLREDDYGYGNNNQNSYHGTADVGSSRRYSEESMPHFSLYSYWQMDELAHT